MKKSSYFTLSLGAALLMTLFVLSLMRAESPKGFLGPVAIVLFVYNAYMAVRSDFVFSRQAMLSTIQAMHQELSSRDA